jgi:cation transport ATPase
VLTARYTAGLPANEALRLAASLDQASNHVVAELLVRGARAAGLALSPPERVHEEGGAGIEGMVEGRHVAVGGPAFVAARVAIPPEAKAHSGEGASLVAVAVDGQLAAVFEVADAIRPEAAAAIAALRRAGIRRVLLATGDQAAAGDRMARGLGFDTVLAELTPEAKVATVLAERAQGRGVIMVGDGINDAPALAAADVGIAMGSGAAGAAEAADIVLLVEDLMRLPQAVSIARRSRRIAQESVAAGIGLSTLGMVLAALGYIPPVQGALIQEAIDVAVILNALRALGGRSPRSWPRRQRLDALSEGASRSSTPR